MLKTKVIASNISNLTDARYYAAWYVDWLGFDLRTASQNKMALEEVKAMKEWIEGPIIVGELELLDFEQGKAIIDYLELDTIQVGMFTPVEYLQSLSDTTIIKEVIIEKNTTATDLQIHIDQYFEVVDYFLLDFGKNGWSWKDLLENIAFNKGHLTQICQKMDILLRINVSPSEIEELVAEIIPFGISVSGSEEEKTGFKSFEEVDKVFEMLEEK